MIGHCSAPMTQTNDAIVTTAMPNIRMRNGSSKTSVVASRALEWPVAVMMPRSANSDQLSALVLRLSRCNTEGTLPAPQRRQR